MKNIYFLLGTVTGNNACILLTDYFQPVLTV